MVHFDVMRAFIEIQARRAIPRQVEDSESRGDQERDRVGLRRPEIGYEP